MFGPVNGSRHDATLLRRSKIIEILHDVCRGGPYAWQGQGLNEDFRLFGDSAYPLGSFLYRMYKGVLAAWQAAFNADMSPERVTAEWGFCKIVALWPYLDYRKKPQDPAEPGRPNLSSWKCAYQHAHLFEQGLCDLLPVWHVPTLSGGVYGRGALLRV